MKPKFVSIKNVDKFVEQQQAKQEKLKEQGEKHLEFYWDGWTVNIFDPHPRARTHERGSYRNGQWGFQTAIAPTTKGFWVFQRKYL